MIEQKQSEAGLKAEREMVLDMRTGQVRPSMAQAPMFSSTELGWKGFLVERHCLGEFAADDICRMNHVVFLQLDQPMHMEWKAEGHSRQGQIQPGHFSLFPAHLPYSMRSPHIGDYLTVSFETSFLACATAELGGLEKVDFRVIHGEDDPLVREIMHSFRRELEQRNTGSALYVESLASALAVHLVRKYTASTPRLIPFVGGLGKQQLRRAIEFMHSQLASNISLHQIAAVADLSPFHFARQFRRSTGLPPHAYVNRCRVERAKQLLMRPNANIAEIAVEVGFCDQSHLTRHFKRHFGLTPAAFATECGAISYRDQQECAC